MKRKRRTRSLADAVIETAARLQNLADTTDEALDRLQTAIMRERRAKNRLIVQATRLALVSQIVNGDAPTRPLPPIIEPPLPPTRDPLPPEPPTRDDPSMFDPLQFERFMQQRDRSEYVDIQPPHSNHAWVINVPDGTSANVHQHRVKLGQYGIKVSHNSPTNNPVQRLQVTDSEFVRWDGYSGVTKWGSRAYNCLHTTYVDCWFHDFDADQSEHGIYENPLSYFYILHCLFENLGGQGVQLVNREEPGSNKDKPNEGENSPVHGGKIVIEESVFRDCGVGRARGSFPISIKDVGRPGRSFDVLICDVLIATNFETRLEGGNMVSSHGGILIQSNQPEGWGYGDVLIERVEIDVHRSDRGLMQINGCEVLVVTDCDFISTDGINPDILLDDPRYEGAALSGKITWTGNRGEGNVRHRGKVVCKISDDWTWNSAEG